MKTKINLSMVLAWFSILAGLGFLVWGVYKHDWLYFIPMFVFWLSTININLRVTIER